MVKYRWRLGTKTGKYRSKHPKRREPYKGKWALGKRCKVRRATAGFHYRYAYCYKNHPNAPKARKRCIQKYNGIKWNYKQTCNKNQQMVERRWLKAKGYRNGIWPNRPRLKY